jgi:hypothetical protein
MTIRTVSCSLAGCLLISLAVAAASVWDTKPFTDWSDKDVEKVMTDSPWAGKASLTHARAGGNQGQVPDWKLIVSVRSGLPYKQAMLRQQIGPGGTATPEQTAAVAADEPLYVIAISGIPRVFQTQAAAIATASLLKRPHKDALKPTEARVLLFDKDGKQVTTPAPAPAPAPEPPPLGGAPGRAAGGRGGSGGGFGGNSGFGGFAEDKSGITATLFLGFAKSDAITVQDDEIELSTTIATYAVKKTFKLKDMVFKGMLAL